MTTDAPFLVSNIFGCINVGITVVVGTPGYEEFVEALKEARTRALDEAKRIIAYLNRNEGPTAVLREVTVELQEYEVSVYAEVYIENDRTDVAEGILRADPLYRKLFEDSERR